MSAWLRSLAVLAVAFATEAHGDWKVIFRADDPKIWEKDVGNANEANGFAIKVAKAPPGVRFLRLKRMDTGDAVIVPMNNNLLPRSQPVGDDVWWSGGTGIRGPEGNKNRLLGIARLSWPARERGQHIIRREPEKLNVGWRGWGFSKEAGTDAPGQTYSWAGERSRRRSSRSR